MARRRRRRYGNFGEITSMDVWLPPLVGGGLAMGGTLILRAFVPEYKEGAPVTEENKNWAFKYAGVLGAGIGIVGSVILGPFRGWGAAMAGGINAVLTGLNGQLYDTVVPAPTAAAAGYGYMVARRPAFGLPYPRSGRRTQLGGFMATAPVNASLPENQTRFGVGEQAAVNMGAFGGRGF